MTITNAPPSPHASVSVLWKLFGGLKAATHVHCPLSSAHTTHQLSGATPMTTKFWGLHVQCYVDFLTLEAVTVNKSLQSLLVETGF